MSKTLKKTLGTIIDDFSVEFDTDLKGDEFKGIFKKGIGSVIYRVNVEFNDPTVSALVRFIVKAWDDGKKFRLLEEYGNGFYAWFNKFLFIGAGEYFGIETDGVNGGRAVIVGCLARP